MIVKRGLVLLCLVTSLAALSSPAAAQQPPSTGKIIFHRYFNDLTSKLYVADSAGVRPFLAPSVAGPNDTNPTWSPDGTQVAFSSDRDGSWSLYIATSDGGQVRRLTTPPASGDAYDPIYDDHADWSPDGKWIAFQSNRDDGQGFGWDNIWIVPSDGSAEPRLVLPTKADVIHESSPSWSPDGQWIAFSAESGPPQCYADPPAPECADRFAVALNYEIWITTPDGATQNFFSNEATDESEPAWSPDGSRIAYLTQLGPFPDLAVLDVASGVSRQVTTTVDRSESAPTWSPDGSRIAFAFPNEDQGIRPNIYSVDASAMNAATDAFVNHTSGAARDDYGDFPHDYSADWLGNDSAATAASIDIARPAALVDTPIEPTSLAAPAASSSGGWGWGHTAVGLAIFLAIALAVAWLRPRLRS